jgi:hypothetical protein
MEEERNRKGHYEKGIFTKKDLTIDTEGRDTWKHTKSRSTHRNRRSTKRTNNNKKNQHNKTKPMTDYPAILIGTINNKVIGESYTSFHTVYVICISKNWGNHIPYANNVLISVSNEYIGYLGEGFIFGIFYGMPPP